MNGSTALFARSPGGVDARILEGFASLERAESWLVDVEEQARRDGVGLDVLRAHLDRAYWELHRAKRLLSAV